MTFFEKNKKIIFIGGSLVTIILCLIIYTSTFSNYKDSLKNLESAKNYTMTISLSLEEKNDEIEAYINSNIDNEQKISSNYFYQEMNDIDNSYKFLTTYENDKYLMYKEQAAEYIETTISSPEYEKLIAELKTLNMDKRKISGGILKYAKYKEDIEYNKLINIFNIYESYFGLTKDNIEEKTYEVLSYINRKGNLAKLTINLNKNITIDNVKYSNAKLTINFEDYNNTKVEGLN